MQGRVALAGDLDVVDLGAAADLEVERGVDLVVNTVRTFVAFHQRQLRARADAHPGARKHGGCLAGAVNEHELDRARHDRAGVHPNDRAVGR